MNKKIIISVAVILIVVAVSFVWWRGRSQQPQKYTGPVEKLNFSSSPGVKNAGVYIAESKGYFEGEGLDVTITQVPSAKDAFLKMMDGEGVDIVALADTPLAVAAFERRDFYILATISEGHDEKVVARKNSGIKAVADLKGKKVGLAGRGIGNHFFLSALLTLNGLTETDVEIIVMDAEKIVPALENGILDAIAVVEPDAAEATKSLGDNAVVFPNQGIYRKTFDITVRKDFAHNHPETLVRFLRAVDKANKFISENKEESQILVAERLKLDKEGITAIWDENSNILSLNQSLLLTLEDEARWAIRNKLTGQTKLPNYVDFIYFDALEKVKPEAMTIIH